MMLPSVPVSMIPVQAHAIDTEAINATLARAAAFRNLCNVNAVLLSECSGWINTIYREVSVSDDCCADEKTLTLRVPADQQLEAQVMEGPRIGLAATSVAPRIALRGYESRTPNPTFMQGAAEGREELKLPDTALSVNASNTQIAARRIGRIGRTIGQKIRVVVDFSHKNLGFHFLLQL
ncbi:hypothetical protein [Ruegeria arenilitoris]|uniref:hypothetical protein n=1 Tax=Ruegeria arenilitoris TaxID=1173585 RepID=UPI00147A801B|nr:hypothetical protein [Ruegeria arenilitoris]